MKCIYCGNDNSRVVDTRDTDESIRRRRECKDCNRRFTTYETAESIKVTVEKEDGTKEEFDEEKVREGIRNAAKNTDLTEEEAEDIVEEVKEEIRGKKKTSTREIGKKVLKELKKRNKVAYVRFASVYDSFEDIESFQKEVESLKAEK